MKRNLLLIIVIVAAACLLVIYLAHNLGAKMTVAFNEDNGFTGSASQEYISLFTSGSRDKLQNRQTYLSKVRNPVSVFGYDNKYLIIESKLNLLSNISFADKINEKAGHVSSTISAVYSEYDYANFNLYFKSGKKNPISDLYLTFNTTPKINVKNDSAACYYLQNGNFSIKYGKDSAIDIFTESRISFLQKTLPKELLLVKRNGSVFFLLMAPSGKNVVLPENSLYKLVFKEN